MRSDLLKEYDIDIQQYEDKLASKITIKSNNKIGHCIIDDIDLEYRDIIFHHKFLCFKWTTVIQKKKDLTEKQKKKQREYTEEQINRVLYMLNKN